MSLARLVNVYSDFCLVSASTSCCGAQTWIPCDLSPGLFFLFLIMQITKL